MDKAQFKLLLLLTAFVTSCNGLSTSRRNEGKSDGDDTKNTERFGDSTVQTGTYPVPINGVQLVDARSIAGLDGLEKNGKVIFTPLVRFEGKLVPSSKLAPGSTAIQPLVDSPGFSIGANGNCSINGHQLICLPGALAASGYSITARVVIKSSGMPDSKAFEKLINKAGYWQLVTRVGENGDLDFPPIPNILVGIGAPE